MISQTVTPPACLNFPIGRKNDIVGLIDLYRGYEVTPSEVYSRLRTMGFPNSLALDYLELIVGTRC